MALVMPRLEVPVNRVYMHTRTHARARRIAAATCMHGTVRQLRRGCANIAASRRGNTRIVARLTDTTSKRSYDLALRGQTTRGRRTCFTMVQRISGKLYSPHCHGARAPRWSGSWLWVIHEDARQNRALSEQVTRHVAWLLAFGSQRRHASKSSSATASPRVMLLPD